MDPCAAFHERLSAFYDGELAGHDADEVASHLESCAACSDRMATFAELDAPLTRAEPPAVGRDEWARRWQAIDSAIRGGAGESKIIDLDEAALRAAEAARRLVRRLIPLAAAACFVLAAVGWQLRAATAAEARVAVLDDEAMFAAAPLLGDAR